MSTIIFPPNHRKLRFKFSHILKTDFLSLEKTFKEVLGGLWRLLLRTLEGSLENLGGFSEEPWRVL